LLLPIGTPASQPVPVFPEVLVLGVDVAGVLGVVLGLAGVVEGFDDVGVDEADAELAAEEGAGVVAVSDVDVALGVVPVADEPAAAFSAVTDLLPCVAHPATPIAIAPTASISAPPLPTPDVLIPFLTSRVGPTLRRLHACFL
jgi:hypothetical protein